MARGLVAALILGTLAGSAIAKDDRTPERHLMVEVIQHMALSIGGGVSPAGLDSRVLAALRSVPRHEFVPRELSHMAYSNRPLPIGLGQTISQPFIVALMTDLLQAKPSDQVWVEQHITADLDRRITVDNFKLSVTRALST